MASPGNQHCANCIAHFRSLSLSVNWQRGNDATPNFRLSVSRPRNREIGSADKASHACRFDLHALYHRVINNTPHSRIRSFDTHHCLGRAPALTLPDRSQSRDGHGSATFDNPINHALVCIMDILTQPTTHGLTHILLCRSNMIYDSWKTAPNRQ